MIKQIMIQYLEESNAYKALQMAVTALELQDGNLYVRDVPGSLSIGRVLGNVYMQGYPKEDYGPNTIGTDYPINKCTEGKMFIR